MLLGTCKCCCEKKIFFFKSQILSLFIVVLHENSFQYDELDSEKNFMAFLEYENRLKKIKRKQLRRGGGVSFNVALKRNLILKQKFACKQDGVSECGWHGAH